ncbi:MAG: DUF928 domain-containing protein [Rhodospirillales bacterium]|nr:DUF928 domain-containing protein [Rhodospirillales bacterium]
MDRSAIFIKLVAAATLSVAGALGLSASVASAAEAPPMAAGSSFPLRSKIGQAPAQEAVPVYVPPRRGAPKDVAAAATRGAIAPRLKLLAPDHTGLTVAAQPTLYIYTQGTGWLQVQVKRAADAGAGFTSPRIEIKDPPAIRAIALAELGVTLDPGAEYRVTVMSYDRSGAVRATDHAVIERIAPPVELSVMTAGQPASAQANAFASAGIWFDALDAISRAINGAPGSAAPRRGRAALLEQIGMKEIANFDRKGLPQG